MQSLDNSTKAFLALVRAGLWEKEVRLLQYQDIVLSDIRQRAEEQSVVGLIAAGLEHVSDIKSGKTRCPPICWAGLAAGAA